MNITIESMQGLRLPTHSDGDSYSDSDIGGTMNIFHFKLQRAGPEIGFQRVWS